MHTSLFESSQQIPILQVVCKWNFGSGDRFLAIHANRFLQLSRLDHSPSTLPLKHSIIQYSSRLLISYSLYIHTQSTFHSSVILTIPGSSDLYVTKTRKK